MATYGQGFLDLTPRVDKGKMGGLTAAFGPLGKAAAGVFVAGFAATVGAGLAAFKIGETFDEAFDTIRVGTGATGQALEDLKGDFNEVFKSVPTDAGSAGQAVADLNTRLGLTGKPLQDLSVQMLELSRITDTDLGANIEAVTRTFGDWGVAVDDQPGKLDAMFRASQATGISVDRLGSQLVQYGAPLRQLGFGFEESAGLIGKFEKEGVNAELVMGSMRIALGKMAREGEPAQETFQRITEDIKNAGSASEANALALELFGARAGPDMAAAIREGRFELGDLFSTISDGEETIVGAAEDTDSFGEKWNELKNKVLVKLEPVASMVFKGMGEAMDNVAPHVEGMVDWFVDRLPAAIDKTAFWFQNTLVPAFQKVIGWVKDGVAQGGGLSGIFDKLKGEAGGLAASLAVLGGPLFIIAKELFPLIKPLLQAILPPFAELANSLAPALAQILGFLNTEILPGLVTILDSVIGWLIDNKGLVVAVGAAVVAFQIMSAVMAVNPFVLLIGAVIAIAALIITNWDTIVGFLKGVWRWIKDAVASVGKWFKDKFAEAVEFVKGLFLNFTPLGLIIKHFDKIKELATGVKDWIVDRFNDMIDFFKRLPGRVTSALGDLFSGLRNAFKNAVNWVIQKWNNFKLQIQLPSILGGGKIGIDTPNIPLFHSGGMVPGASGQEMLAILEAGERVLSRAEVAADVQRSSGGVLAGANITLQGTPESLIRDLGERVGFEIRMA